MAGTRRTLVARARFTHFSEEALRLFAYIVDRESGGLAPGSPEHNSLAVQLHRELGRRVWDTNVLDVDVDAPPPDEPVRMKRESWETAVELRRALEAELWRMK
jgi:hypothetical protein